MTITKEEVLEKFAQGFKDIDYPKTAKAIIDSGLVVPSSLINFKKDNSLDVFSLSNIADSDLTDSNLMDTMDFYNSYVLSGFLSKEIHGVYSKFFMQRVVSAFDKFLTNDTVLSGLDDLVVKELDMDIYLSKLIKFRLINFDIVFDDVDDKLVVSARLCYNNDFINTPKGTIDMLYTEIKKDGLDSEETQSLLKETLNDVFFTKLIHDKMIINWQRKNLPFYPEFNSANSLVVDKDRLKLEFEIEYVYMALGQKQSEIGTTGLERFFNNPFIAIGTETSVM